MTASRGPRPAPVRLPESAFASRSSLGILLTALVLLSPPSSDACDDPPRFESMMLIDIPKILYDPGDKIEYQCRLGYEPILPYLPSTAICQRDNTWTPLQEACTRRSCPQLEEPLNGQIIYVNRTFQFGSQAHYVCNEGYHLLGKKIVYCELSGSNVDWSDNLPACVKIICQAPPTIANGKYTNSDKPIFDYNEVVTYSCNPSMGPEKYSLVGESKLICRGLWSSDPPECKVVRCQYPVVENGRLVSGFGRKYYYTDQVVFECNQGFRLKGNSTVFCGANSVWEPEMPECIKENLTPSDESQHNDVNNLGTYTCDDPPRFESMRLFNIPKTLYNPGDKIQYQCRLGYKPILPYLPTTAVCQPDNTWTPLQEACTRKSCPQLEEPLNGQIIYVNRTFQFGSQAHYVCNEGFHLLGKKIVYCELSGSNVDWSDNPPECEKIMCRAPPNIANGKYTNSDKPIFDYNEVVTYSCNPSMGPEKYSLVGESKLICRGLWSSDPPECKVVKCQYPVVKHGRLVSGFGRKYYYTDQVVFECNQGFRLKGNSTIFCGANSVWEPEMPECIEENLTPSDESRRNDINYLGTDACDDPPSFESMMLVDIPKTLYNPGEKIEYQCHLGYEPILPYLPTTAVCQPDNTWTPLQEACTRRSCPQLEEPLNGQIIYVNRTFQFGSQAHYVCNEGFHLHGTKILHCELSGGNVDWSDNPPECEKIMCRAPPNIANGKYTNSDKPIFDYNEVVTYSCNPSMGPEKYSLVGESKLICRGLWSSDPPECKVVKCQYPVVKHGRLVSGFGRKHYYTGLVSFECDKGFQLKGNGTIVCGANSEWEPEMPQCIKENLTFSDESQPNDVNDLENLTPSDESQPNDVNDLENLPPSDESQPNDVNNLVVGDAVAGTYGYYFFASGKEGNKEYVIQG